jgi:hypothetical protein
VAGVSGEAGSRYEIPDTRYASAVWTPRQTNPITLYVVAPTLPRYYMSKVGVAMENNANFGRWQAVDPRDRPSYTRRPENTLPTTRCLAATERTRAHAKIDTSPRHSHADCARHIHGWYGRGWRPEAVGPAAGGVRRPV